jgi:hypothetical protein
VAAAIRKRCEHTALTQIQSSYLFVDLPEFGDLSLSQELIFSGLWCQYPVTIRRVLYFSVLVIIGALNRVCSILYSGRINLEAIHKHVDSLLNWFVSLNYLG